MVGLAAATPRTVAAATSALRLTVWSSRGRQSVMRTSCAPRAAAVSPGSPSPAPSSITREPPREPAGEEQRTRPYTPASAALPVVALVDENLNRGLPSLAETVGTWAPLARLGVTRIEEAIRSTAAPQQKRCGGGGLYNCRGVGHVVVQCGGED
eukprot:scaffold25489_cov238-Isochrysis_galbana.AAC.4